MSASLPMIMSATTADFRVGETVYSEMHNAYCTVVAVDADYWLVLADLETGRVLPDHGHVARCHADPQW